MSEQSIIVTHNVEMGHRLSQQPDSKCYHLHGHSWWIELELFAPLDDKGMVGGLNFGDVKKTWREYLDIHFDHHMCLNEDDPLVQMLYGEPHSDVSTFKLWGITTIPYDPTVENMASLWGITTLPYDPTVENMASLWGRQAEEFFRGVSKVSIKVKEAATNAATWRNY
jgi:6-pyruvoyl-tetrahydropterin synthase